MMVLDSFLLWIQNENEFIGSIVPFVALYCNDNLPLFDWVLSVIP